MHKGIYKDKNNTWYIHTSIQGKTVTIRGFQSKKDADENYEIAIEKWKCQHNHRLQYKTYENVVNEYYEYRGHLVRQESLRKDRTQLDGYYKKIFLNDTINNVFEAKRLSSIYKDILTNKEFSSQKQMRLVLVFREFTKFCYAKKYINQTIYDDILMIFIPVKEDKHTVVTKRYIPETHINDLLSEIIKDNDNLFYLAVSVLYSCGLRISELLGLIGSDIDLDNKKIKVQRQLLTNGQLSTQLKTSNSYREVPISCLLFDNLWKIRKKLNNNARFFDYSHTTFKRKLKQYTDYSAHEFRHTFCTNLAKKCSNIADVTYCAKVSGHSVSMFLNTYCKSLDNELENKFFAQ